MDPCLISGTGGVASGVATLTVVRTTPAISEARLAQWYALFSPAAQDEVAVRSKVPAAQIYAKRFNALPNMDSIAVGLLFDCIRFIFIILLLRLMGESRRAVDQGFNDW
jgi:hypothetical protein